MKRAFNELIIRLLFHDPEVWSPRERLLVWGRGGPAWTIRLSCEGSVHMGSSGSGKTSGPVRAQFLACARAGYGILALTTKETPPSDVDFFLGLAREAGRENSVVLFGPGHPLRYNMLRDEMRAAGNGTEMISNVVSTITLAAELQTQTAGQKANTADPVWRLSMEALLRNAGVLVFVVTGDLRFEDLAAVARTAPQSDGQLNDAAWRRGSKCIHFIEQAQKLRPNDRHVAIAVEYFMQEFPNYPAETKNCVLFSFTAGCGDLFRREPLHRLFFSGTDFTPEILLDGAIVIVDCPINKWGDVGRYVNGLMRIQTQRMLDRRARNRSQRPVAIFWDEMQKTMIPYDSVFQQTARSAKCAVVAATQDISGLRSVVGRDQAASALSNLRTKVFSQINDPDTCAYATALCAKETKERRGEHHGADGKVGITKSPELVDKLPSDALHDLRTGGEENGYRVEGILIVGSKKLPGGKPFKKTVIHQKKLFGWLLNRRVRVVAQKRPVPDFRCLRGVEN
jgi:type IV secretory pathway TraG/TraD family ATPase VirD4